LSQRFAGAVAIVTGAAGDIGGAAARRLAAEGAALALLDRRAEGLAQIEEACRDAGARSVLGLAADQTDREAVDAAVEQVVDRLGPIDVLFANAGYGQFASFLETSQRNWTRHIDVNVTGTFNVCQAVAAQMVQARRGGAIVVNASSAAHVYSDRLFAYSVSKAAVRMLGMGLASELGGHRIRVNVVMPGVVETAMNSASLDDGHRESMVSQTPIGRLGRAEDVARLVAFLASPEAEFITGASVTIDGGQTLHGWPRWFALDYSEPHSEEWRIPHPETVTRSTA
jgi:NAD(P)-dependent dehydrogenase (short-subunit alcohol dehydrogenase family)